MSVLMLTNANPYPEFVHPNTGALTFKGAINAFPYMHAMKAQSVRIRANYTVKRPLYVPTMKMVAV
jgi:hypothetical protein